MSIMHYGRTGDYEAVRLLLSKGVDVDVLTCRHLSPLQLAAGNGHDQAVKVLLEHGADVRCYILSTLALLHWQLHLCIL